MDKRLAVLALCLTGCAGAATERAVPETAAMHRSIGVYDIQGGWVPILVEHDDPLDTLSVVRTLSVALMAQGVDLVDPGHAAIRFDNHSLAPEQPPTPKMVEEARLRIQAALEATAFEQWKKASSSARVFWSATDGTRDYLKRHPAIADDLWAYCWMFAQGLARAQELSDEIWPPQIAGLSPDVGTAAWIDGCAAALPHHELPDWASTQPPLVSAWNRVHPRRSRATLRVAMSPEVEGCVASIHGKLVELPAVAEALPTDIRIQVDCEGHFGRVHKLELKPGDNRIVVDPLLERALRTPAGQDRYVGLRYETMDQQAAWQVKHGLAVARKLGGGALLLVTKTPTGRLGLTRVDAQLERVITEVTIEVDPSERALMQAAAALALPADRGAPAQ